MRRVIVIDRHVGSMTEFKQIVGRGTRVHEDTKKFYWNEPVRLRVREGKLMNSTIRIASGVAGAPLLKAGCSPVPELRLRTFPDRRERYCS
jgi:hypothetical protein